MTFVKFRAGDTVRLIAGGPDLTIKAIQGGTITVVWFSGTKLQQATFPEQALRLTSDLTDAVDPQKLRTQYDLIREATDAESQKLPCQASEH